MCVHNMYIPHYTPCATNTQNTLKNDQKYTTIKHIKHVIHIPTLYGIIVTKYQKHIKNTQKGPKTRKNTPKHAKNMLCTHKHTS